MNTKKPDINAEPTKDFFIRMLTKDIDLGAAIIDLVDNCIDGARRLRSNNKFDGLEVKVLTGQSEFEVVDNCGGIDIDIAKNYAFRFGRPDDWTPLKHSVGQFGVGMKRALFKIGNDVQIKSNTSTHQFGLNIDVKAWSESPVWGFDFSGTPGRKRLAPEQTGTSIRVTALHQEVSTQFSDEQFRSRLADELQAKHYESVNRGMKITVNGFSLTPNEYKLAASEKIKPCKVSFDVPLGRKKVAVQITCGVLEEDRKYNVKNAGWYVYCNGREILHADKTWNTGWGDGNGSVVPVFHNQFSTFRGYVTLDADDGALLPWNTTKTGVEVSSNVFQAVRRRMVEIMRKVVDFQNDVDKENEIEDPADRPLQIALTKASSSAVTIAKVSGNASFIAPARTKQILASKGQTIRYVVPTPDFERVMEYTGPMKPGELGKKTFYYYMRQEVDP